MHRSIRRYIILFLIVCLIGFSCRKKDNGSAGGGNPPPNPTSTTCIISGISQMNSGTKTESGMTTFYDNAYNVMRIIIYDSVNNIKTFDANFNYITADS